MKIKLMGAGYDVNSLRWNLRKHPEIWNLHTDRTKDPESPHFGLDDIWIRYAPGGEQTKDAHASQWYPSAYTLGAIDQIKGIFKQFCGTELGGVLITRIPAGMQCKPHEDHGWHARAYEKFALQIESAPGQVFCFDGEEFATRPGDLFWFDNQYKHWVMNPTPYERVTMIICMKR